VVDAHQHAEEGVEDDPRTEPPAHEVSRRGEADRGEDEGDSGDEEAGFLVLEDGEEDDAGEGGYEVEGWEGGREEEEGGGAEEEGEVDESVLVVWVEAVEGEVCGLGVVEEVVEGGYYG